MEGPDVRLGLREVDASLPAVGRVDLGHERGGHLEERNAPLVGRGAEAGDVADHSPSEGDQVVVPGHPRIDQLRPDPLGGLERLLRLAGIELELALAREELGVPRPYVPVRDDERAALERREARADQPLAHVGRVAARLPAGPDHPEVARRVPHLGQVGRRPRAASRASAGRIARATSS